MKIPIIFILFLLLLNPVANAIEPTDCIKLINLSCDNCAAINMNIIQNVKTADYYVVENYFYYNISLTGISDNMRPFVVNVSVENPERKQVNRNRTYHIESLRKNISIFLTPNQSVDNKLFDVYEFDMAGAYNVKLIGDAGIIFYRFYDDCSFSYSAAPTYYFDTMPRWQYESWKKQDELNAKMMEADDKVVKLTEAVVILTLVLVFLTVLLVGWEMRETINKNIRMIITGYAILLIYLAKASITDYATIILIVASLAVNFKELKKIEGLALFVFYGISAMLSWVFYEIAQVAYLQARYVDVLIYSGFLAFSLIVFIGSLRLLKKNPI